MKETDTAIYFWGGIFSNFYPLAGGSVTSEKFFMMSKAILFNDEPSLKKIAMSASPMAAKRLGRKVKNFNPEVWDKMKEPAMMSALMHKFAISPDFQVSLKESGNKLLVEASPDDSIWGIGFSEHDAEGNEANWGQNLLGKCLMELRDGMLG